MAQKKITELGLIDEVTDGVNIVGDDSIQTYRFTALQLKNYIDSAIKARLDLIEADNWVTTTRINNLAVTPEKLSMPMFQTKPSNDYTHGASTSLAMKFQSVGVDTIGGTMAIDLYTLPASGAAGWYLIVANWAQSKPNSTSGSDVYIYKNGSPIATQYHTSATSGTGHSLSALIELDNSDNVTSFMRPIGYSATINNTRTNFSLIRLT